MIAPVTERLRQIPSSVMSKPLTVAVSGASGLVGSALSSSMVGRNWKLKRLVRDKRRESESDNIMWNLDAGIVDVSSFSSVDAVVHLAGENIATGRWTAATKWRIRDSRVMGTRRLCESLAALPQPPSVLVCASAIGYYGERGNQSLDESEPPGLGFLPEVCTEWERATQPAVDAGIRVVQLRIGVVLSPAGGALKEMLLPFRFGVGGKIGSGRQYWSWISLPDLVHAIQFALGTESLSGPVNAVAPNAVTNAEFTRTLGRVLRRPTLFPLPAFVARLVLGEMANDLLLSSIRVTPNRLQRADFEFQHPDLESALRSVLNRKDVSTGETQP